MRTRGRSRQPLGYRVCENRPTNWKRTERMLKKFEKNFCRKKVDVAGWRCIGPVHMVRVLHIRKKKALSNIFYFTSCYTICLILYPVNLYYSIAKFFRRKLYYVFMFLTCLLFDEKVRLLLFRFNKFLCKRICSHIKNIHVIQCKSYDTKNQFNFYVLSIIL